MSLKPGIWPGELIIEWMVIDMNEAQVCSLEQVLQVLAGTQALEFRQAEDDEGRYAWVESVLGRLNYRVCVPPASEHEFV